jgi:hypothetical protein
MVQKYRIDRPDPKIAYNKVLGECQARAEQILKYLADCERQDKKIMWTDISGLNRLLNDLDAVSKYLPLEVYAHL